MVKQSTALFGSKGSGGSGKGDARDLWTFKQFLDNGMVQLPPSAHRRFAYRRGLILSSLARKAQLKPSSRTAIQQNAARAFPTLRDRLPVFKSSASTPKTTATLSMNHLRSAPLRLSRDRFSNCSPASLNTRSTNSEILLCQ